MARFVKLDCIVVGRYTECLYVLLVLLTILDELDFFFFQLTIILYLVYSLLFGKIHPIVSIYTEDIRNIQF